MHNYRAKAKATEVVGLIVIRADESLFYQTTTSTTGEPTSFAHYAINLLRPNLFYDPFQAL